MGVFYHAFMILNICFLIGTYQDKSVSSMLLNIVCCILWGINIGSRFDKLKN